MVGFTATGAAQSAQYYRTPEGTYGHYNGYHTVGNAEDNYRTWTGDCWKLTPGASGEAVTTLPCPELYSHYSSASFAEASAALQEAYAFRSEYIDTVTADFDGDGVDEYVVLAKNNSAEPLKILVFSQTATGYVLMDTISAYGFAFDSIEFCNVDDRPGAEIIAGRQVGDGVVRSVAIYSLYSGFARQLMETNYSRMLVRDMNLDGRSELMLLQSAGSAERSCYAVLYQYRNGQMEISSQYEVPYAVGSIQSMEGVTLHDGTPAMMITSVEKNLRKTELFIMR